jgi:hypothetical protein
MSNILPWLAVAGIGYYFYNTPQARLAVAQARLDRGLEPEHALGTGARYEFPISIGPPPVVPVVVSAARDLPPVTSNNSLTVPMPSGMRWRGPHKG